MYRYCITTYSPFAVPVNISLSHDGRVGTVYAGSLLTLTCTITLPLSVSGVISNLSVNASWTGVSTGELIGSSRVTIQPPYLVTGSVVFLSHVEFNTLRTSDSDTYVCTVTVTPSGSLGLIEGQHSVETTIAVVSKCSIAWSTFVGCSGRVEVVGLTEFLKMSLHL